MRSICVLAHMECPKTGDMSAKRFCPHWKEGILEHETDASGRITMRTYTGCQVPKIIPYLQSVAVEANHAHAAANLARDSAIEAAQSGQALTREFRLQEDKLRAVILPALIPAISDLSLQGSKALELSRGEEEREQAQ